MARRSNVVDFERFRAERSRRRLPLFDDPVSLERERPEPPAELTPRAAAHRARMLEHLLEQARGGRA
jgi:hypothetical protein